MPEPSEIDALTSSLIEERLDSEKARVFATLVVREAAGYKPTAVTSHVLRRDMLTVADAIDDAIRAISAATDESRHFSSAQYLSAKAISRPTRNIKLTSSGLWDQALKKQWPDIEKTPPIGALLAYLKTYAEAARSLANGIPAPGRGKPPDFEKYRPVLLCAGAWMHAFGKKPGKGENTPFTRACRCALPLFGQHVPKALDLHIANALRGIDLKKF